MIRLRIFFVANQGEIGGGEVMLLALAKTAAQLGAEAHVVAPRVPRQVRDQSQRMGLPTHALRGAGRLKYAAALWGWSRRVDGLIWANGLFPAVATVGVRRVVHLHQQPRSRVQVALEKVARIRTVRRLVPSHYLADRVAGSVVLENWVEAVPRGERHDGAIGGGAAVRVGFAGRLSTDKGVDTLAAAVQVLVTRGKNVQLVLAGEPRFVADAQAQAVESALDDLGERVTYLGWGTPAEYLAQVDVAVVPSRAPEAFGLVAAEAMSARVPLVVSDAGALPEIVGASYPWVARAGEVQSLSDTIEAAIDAMTRGDLVTVDAAYDRWCNHYSPEAGRQRLQSLLDTLDD